MSFTFLKITTKKTLDLKLTKEVKDFYNEKSKTLKKNIQEDTRRK